MLQDSERGDRIARAVRRFVPALLLAVPVMLAPGALAQDHQLVRVILPFPVADGGLPLRYPFLGGFDAPRPQFVDIDGDGDQDLMVQEQVGSVMFFRNEGTATAPDYSYVTDRYQGLDVGQWFVFFDTDDDGDADLLAERPFGRLRLYRNDGSATAPSFSLAVDTLRADDGSVITAEATIPAIYDVDCNGRIDLMIGRQAGTITRFEWVEEDADANPIFAFVEDRYQDIEVVGGIGKRGSTALHGASSIVFSDIDADGDPDVLWGDFFEPNLILFRNEGTCSTPQFVRETDALMRSGADPISTSGFNAPRVTDIDADGRTDLFVGVLGGAFVSSSSSVDNFYHFELTGEVSELLTTRFLTTIDVGSEATPVVADLDGDGRLDLAVGNIISPEDPTRGSVAIIRNAGEGLVVADADAVPLGGFSATPAASDVDCDQDVDLLVGAFDGTLSLFLKALAGSASDWTLSETPYQGIDVGSASAPAWADIDADGDEDLFVGEGAGTVNFFRNTGSACQPALVLENEQYAGIDVGQRSRPAFTDYDSDGDLDLFVGSDTGRVYYFRNDGSAFQPQFVESESVQLPVTGVVSPAAGDFDLDGDPDLIVGVSSGGLLYYRNDRVATAAVHEPGAPGGGITIASVYPNPSDRILTVEVVLATSGSLQVDIVDVLGRRVRRRAVVSASAGGSRFSIDGSALAPGVYLLVLTRNSGESAATRFTIAR